MRLALAQGQVNAFENLFIRDAHPQVLDDQLTHAVPIFLSCCLWCTLTQSRDRARLLAPGSWSLSPAERCSAPATAWAATAAAGHVPAAPDRPAWWSAAPA